MEMIKKYKKYKQLGQLNKNHLFSILFCTKDTDKWLINYVWFKKKTGEIIENAMIIASELKDRVDYLTCKGYSGLVKTKL